MDAMALLCTLHADGPATLKRLRQSGCTTLEALATLDAERVAAILASTPASARRLQREAESLRARLSGDGLERESAPDAEIPRSSRPYAGSPGASARAAHALEAHTRATPASASQAPSNANTPASEPRTAPAARAFSADLDSTPSALPRPAAREPMARREHSAANSGESVPISGAGLEARDQRLVQRVLETWRARDVAGDGEARDVSTATSDARSATGFSTHTPPSAGVHGSTPSSFDIDVTERAAKGRDAHAPLARELESGTPLRIGLVDSLDADLVAQLCAAGVFSLEELGASDAVALAGRVPVSFSRLARLIALARRALPEQPVRASAARPFAAVAPALASPASPRANTRPALASPPAAARSRAGEPPKISWSELPPVFDARGLALELPEALKTTPPSAPNIRPARQFETGREGAGGPFA